MIIIVLNGSIKWDTIAVHSFWFTVHRFNKLDERWVTRIIIRLYLDILCVHNVEGKNSKLRTKFATTTLFADLIDLMNLG
ncbi:hypothetical protein BK054_06860 [Myroides sp. ZB35]|nr:hypothetical protein BK054_06860 [Myroides sp. ZB35]